MQIAPFQALRYDPARISSISRVVAPPFDMVDRDAAEDLHNRDPHNVIRLILGKDGQGTRDEKEYGRASETFAAWRRDGVLVPEDEPAVYVCEHSFVLDENKYLRRGLICAMLLEDFSSGHVFPHERTVAGPRADRLRLFRACEASLSLVFGIFTDPEARVDSLLEQTPAGPPIYEFEGGSGTGCKLWRVTDPDRIAPLASALRSETLCIADGHHRYETALRYRDEFRSRPGPPGSAPEDFIQIFCVSVKNAGLKTLPSHRLVKADQDFDPDALLEAVGRRFDIREIAPAGRLGPGQLAAALRDAGDGIGCWLPGDRLFLFTPKAGGDLEDVLPEGPREWQHLPVTRLHYGILEPHFGIVTEGEAADPRLAYSHNAEEVRWAVARGGFGAGFLLPAIEPATVEKLARMGRRMPSKSTYFHPKIDSGLVFYPFENQGTVPRIALS